MDAGPREKLVRTGADRLSDQELLMLILGRGSKGNRLSKLARSLLKLLDENRDPSVQDLTSIEGIHFVRAAMIQAMLEFGRRRQRKGHGVQGPDDLFQAVRHLGDRPQEFFLCIPLDGAGRIIDVHTVTIGLVNRTLIHPREVFAPALMQRAVSIIVAHNHPSGELEPSQEDRQVTRRLLECGELLGIPLLDHIVFHSEDFRSILQC